MANPDDQEADNSATGTPPVAGDRRAPSSRPVRRRQRGRVRRPYRVGPVFSAIEYEDVVVAATLAGMTPSAYVAKCAIDVARGTVRPLPPEMADAVRELIDTRYQVQRFSGLVNQAMKKWHSTNEQPPELLRAVDLVLRVLPGLEHAAAAIVLAQGGVRRRRTLPRQRRRQDDARHDGHEPPPPSESAT